jgi:hypothetical protein
MSHARPAAFPLILLGAMLAATGPVARAGDDAYAGGDSATVAAAPKPLKPGEFEWHPERSVAGPVLVVVSIDDQLAHVYRSGVRIATTTVSTGRPGNETPTGVFNILQKKKMHHSNLYDDAPMPFMQRLTWDGVALHAGRIPGHPASHGCIRLPLAFAQKLYGVTYHGGTVVVVDSASSNTLDLAGLPAGWARLVLQGPSWRDAALPGAATASTFDTREPTLGGGGVGRVD